MHFDKILKLFTKYIYRQFILVSPEYLYKLWQTHNILFNITFGRGYTLTILKFFHHIISLHIFLTFLIFLNPIYYEDSLWNMKPWWNTRSFYVGQKPYYILSFFLRLKISVILELILTVSVHIKSNDVYTHLVIAIKSHI